MALFAKSKVERFQDETSGSSLGPGDYDPCVPKSNGHRAGAASLGFTARKGLHPPEREGPIPEDTEAIFYTARDRRPSIALSPKSPKSPKRMSVSASRLPSNGGGVSRLEKLETEHQAKHLTWSEREREKLQEDLAKLRLREVGR